MKQLFTILFSAVVLISATFFISCSGDDSNSSGDNYYTEENNNSSNGTVSEGNEKDENSSSETETKGKIILHAQYPYIYVWESGSQFDNTQSEMKAEGNGWYRFEIESSSAMVIFKPNADDWNGQTDDLHATAGEWWYKDGKLSESKPSGGQEFVTIPSAPKNVTTEATSSSSIKVSWNAVDSADDYIVYYRLSLGAGNESYERNGTETTKTTTGTSVSITGLEYKMYLFWVTAKNSAGESYESDIKFDYPYSTTGSSGSSSEGGSSGTTTTLSAPTGLIAIATSSSSVELTWNSVDEATMYYVYQSEDYSSSTASVVSSTASTSTTVSGLKENTTYYFWVKALEDTTMSDYSSYAYATTKAASSSSSGTTTSNTATIYFVGSSSAISATGFNNIYVGNYQFGDLFTSVKTSKTLSAGTVDGPYQIEAGTYLLKFGNPATGVVTNAYSITRNNKRGTTDHFAGDYEFSFESGKTYSIIKNSSSITKKGRDGSTSHIISYKIDAKEGTD